MKKILTVVAVLTALTAKAQTNIQVQYDFVDKSVISTVEHFSSDKWGNTFFFVDLTKEYTYGEIARCFNFWQESKWGDLSAQLEYDWQDAILVGPNHCFHNSDYSKTCNLQVLYKGFLGEQRCKDIPIQFTCVWTINDLLKVSGLQFTGYLDVWYENRVIVMTEPQLWYQIFEHCNVGGELCITENFYKDGLAFNPRLGLKWVF